MLSMRVWKYFSSDCPGSCGFIVTPRAAQNLRSAASASGSNGALTIATYAPGIGWFVPARVTTP